MDSWEWVLVALIAGLSVCGVGFGLREMLQIKTAEGSNTCCHSCGNSAFLVRVRTIKQSWRQVECDFCLTVSVLSDIRL